MLEPSVWLKMSVKREPEWNSNRPVRGSNVWVLGRTTAYSLGADDSMITVPVGSKNRWRNAGEISGGRKSGCPAWGHRADRPGRGEGCCSNRARSPRGAPPSPRSPGGSVRRRGRAAVVVRHHQVSLLVLLVVGPVPAVVEEEGVVRPRGHLPDVAQGRGGGERVGRHLVDQRAVARDAFHLGRR